MRADFNDDGFADLAIGVAGEDVGGVEAAGAVHVIYGSENGLSATAARPDQFWTQDSANVAGTAEEFDVFGSALAAGDLNGDGFADLAVGVPEENVGSVNNAGAVNVIYGSRNGLSATAARPDQLWTQNSANVADTAEPNDGFGFSLAAADFGAGSAADLAIGAYQEDVGRVSFAGAVNVIYGSENGLSATAARPDQFWTQESANVEGTAEAHDELGTSLAAADFGAGSSADLAIGVHGDNVGSVESAGAVNVIYGSRNGLSATSARPDQLWTQDSTNVEDAAESGDELGRSVVAGDFGASPQNDLAIGAPQEAIGTATDAGAVNVIYGSPNGLSATAARLDQFWTQDSANINGIAEPDDWFGRSLAAANFGTGLRTDLAIGVPEEDIGSVSNAGAVVVIYGSRNGLSATAARPDQLWTQNSANVADTAEPNDGFGFALVGADFGAGSAADLAVATPFEDLRIVAGGGAVHIIYGSRNGLSASAARSDQFWTQNSPDIHDGAEQDDWFGYRLAALR